MLKLCTETDLLTETHRSHVFPLLFDLCYIKRNAVLKLYMVKETLSESDIAVWPLEYGFTMTRFKGRFLNFLKLAKNNNKKVWVYTGGDYGFTFYDKNIYNFRLGGFKSNLSENDILLASFINDPLEDKLKQNFKILKKKDVPEIGFVGHASGGVFKFLRELFQYWKTSLFGIFKRNCEDHQSFYPSGNKRSKYLKILANNKEILNNFILRKNYRAGAKTDEDREKTAWEFYNNIYNSPYTFCMRGKGNFSVRFYETLALGRIPVFLNTDCKLPLEDEINWKKHVVWIEENDGHYLDKKLLEFHNNISDEEFENIQQNNRNLWNDYLKRHSFFKHIHDKFINIV